MEVGTEIFQACTAIKINLENGTKIPFDTLRCAMLHTFLYAKVKKSMKLIQSDPLMGSIELPIDSGTDKPLYDFLNQAVSMHFDAEVNCYILW